MLTVNSFQWIVRSILELFKLGLIKLGLFKLGLFKLGLLCARYGLFYQGTLK